MARPTHLILVVALSLLLGPVEAQLVCGARVPERLNLNVAEPRGGTGLKVIPVVVHVLHTGGPENISDAQIFDAMAALNEAYHMPAGDTLGVYPGDTVVTADAQIAFCLASVDPDGEATTGIDRIFSELTNEGQDPVAKLNPWSRANYLNIWVVQSSGEGTWGYTLYPADADALPEQDGVVIRYTYFGGTGASQSFLRHTLTHEVGHYLDLLHPWDLPTGFGTCGDDLVSDTPITSPDLYCPTNVSVCAPPTIEYLPNFMNFYGCQMMFTAGQAVRLQACLNSPVAERNNLWTEANIAATGACLPTGLAETNGTNGIEAFPNPFQWTVRISGCTPGTTKVQIYDTRGALEFEHSAVIDARGILDLDLSHIEQPGLYLLRITNGSGIRSVRLLRE